MPLQFRLVSLALLALVAGSLRAQTPPQNASQSPPNSGNSRDVVVTGRSQVPLKRAQRFVHQVVSLNEGQLARFVDPVCPQVFGVRSDLAAAIAQRFRDTATSAGARVASATCEPNVMIALVDDSDAFLKVVRKRHSSFFDDLQGVDLHNAFRSGSIHSWRLIETRDEEGNGGGGNSDDGPSTYTGDTQAVTVNAVVVMDKRVVSGKSPRQIADYAAIRALAGARPPKRGSIDADTILSLFDANATPSPAELTTMDRSFLSELYAISGTERDAMAQASYVSRQMATSGIGGRRSGQRRR